MTGPLLRSDAREAVARRPRAGRALDRPALACLVLGLLALGAGLALALSHEARPRTGTNGVWPQFPLGALGPGQRVCQDAELLPAGTGALQFAILPAQRTGPRIAVTLSRGGETIARSSLLAGARDAGSGSAPVQPRAQDLDGVRVCLAVDGRGQAGLLGGPTPADAGELTADGRPTGASIPITYVEADAASWWSRASSVFDRIGLGRGDWGGGWIAWAAAALLLGALALVVLALVRGVIAPADDWRLTAGAIAAVAVLNAAAWSLITPAFQVPDEQTHAAYAQQIGEAGRPPVARRGDEQLAPELVAAMAGTRFGSLEARTFGAAVTSPLQQRRLHAALHGGLARRSGNDTAGPAAPEPPLYYALEAIPYRVASGATLLDRLMLMRLFSALLAGVTALFAFLFVRECLPGRPWAWTVGGLGAALHPLLGFVSGGVNPDALLFPICAALFHALATAFRRGLTTRRAVWIGAIVAAGVVGKINFYGLVPGALLAVALAARASAGGLLNVRALRLLGIVVGVAVTPFLLLTALDHVVWDRGWILAHTPAERPEDHGGLGGQLSYLWQVFLPRLPGQETAFPEFYPGWQLWLKGFLGKFGWTVVGYAEWAYRTAALALGVVGVLALRALVRERAAVRERLPELIGYAAMAAGLVLLVGMVALRGFAPGVSGAIQGRYLLPLLPLFGGLLVLAARGAGARWGRAVGVALVLACAAWGVFGQLLTIAWFYG
ncbi:MAG TPA: DUF2142 domain-containing protein [Conexibacter sp.]|nr:DUF2142 domain-containing protein [Conexibacter sp.]